MNKFFCILFLPLVMALASCVSTGAQRYSLNIFAAASLKKIFSSIGNEAIPGRDVEPLFNFAGSPDLVTQLKNGADSDLLATADELTMQQAESAGLVYGHPVIFAQNFLTIVVPENSKKNINSLHDLAQPGLKVVQCAAPVPCGHAALSLEKANNIQVHPISEEDSVTSVLDKVITGQADAGIVYRTDAQSHKEQVRAIDPGVEQKPNNYPVAVLKRSTKKDLANKFITYLTSGDGKEKLRKAGFR